jgi:hypothetical protein
MRSCAALLLVSTSACLLGTSARNDAGTSDGWSGDGTTASTLPAGTIDTSAPATSGGIGDATGVTSHGAVDGDGTAGSMGGGGSSGGDTPGPKVRFAVIGDYGTGTDDEESVADLVASWNVDFVITLGDNNYYAGAAATIDDHIGQYYWRFIGNYQGFYGPGSVENRFWPCPGNHDWGAPDLVPYRDYFTLPGNERYYDVDKGLVHLWSLDSDTHEPDGVSSDSVQGQWLEAGLAASQSCYDIVYFHHAAYSSSSAHGSSEYMQWPFEEWGAEAVLAGHDHTYERLQVGLIPYFVNGLGGAGRYGFGPELPETIVRHGGLVGAQLVTATPTSIRFEFYEDDGTLLDVYTVPSNCSG